MSGAAGIVQQCVRCFSLRDVEAEGEECPTCKEKLNEVTRETRPLVLCNLAHDTGFKVMVGHGNA